MKLVALTYDDGPAPQTESLVTFLVAQGAHATFFLRGDRCAERPEVVTLLDAAPGIELASHSHTHPDLHVLDAAGIRSELDRSNETIAAITGRVPTHFRPPMGHRNGLVDRIAKELGQSVTLWSLNSMDFKDRSSITEHVLARVHHGDIILLHDTHSETVEATRDLVPALRSRGFALVTVSELLGECAPGRVYRGRNSLGVRLRRWAELQWLRISIRAARLFRRRRHG